MDNDLFGGDSGGGMDLFGGGKAAGDKQFGRSEAHATIGGDVQGLQLDNTTLITVAAIAGAVLILIAMLFRR